MMEFSKLTQALSDLKDDEVLDMINDFMKEDPDEQRANELMKAAQEGMAVVGDRFERGDYFVGDLIFAGEILTEVIDIIKPAIGVKTQQNIKGKIVLGTVKGDLHDIGKNIFKIMATAEGFEVHDIGIDQPVEAFVEKVREIKPDIMGMSGVLTLALDAMKMTVDGLVEADLRENLKVIIGGNPVSKDASENIGADAFTTNAAEGLMICKEWMQK
ncbi:cobalamin-binding protein [Alkalibaculum sp. M08DMB]|uniref:Cobalamin-binding protein n=1 Tax=Alkalibaculum sporogenes TaxID=2655001 RepID=A0A6A7KB61_9FIRM|nr:cobalamin-dependent protein [Alkalibaculum sporogenes]MPW26612.1 cobalamin-binding protein [Alkalibaculum sporogenes]